MVCVTNQKQTVDLGIRTGWRLQNGKLQYYVQSFSLSGLHMAEQHVQWIGGCISAVGFLLTSSSMYDHISSTEWMGLVHHWLLYWYNYMSKLSTFIST